MANNRMWIKHKPSEKVILLCKYYPTPGWYQFCSEEELNKFMEDTRMLSSEARNVDWMWGNTDYELTFEHPED